MEGPPDRQVHRYVDAEQDRPRRDRRSAAGSPAFIIRVICCHAYLPLDPQSSIESWFEAVKSIGRVW
jgi:hypothetical protein